jgi:thioesterase domain-containing protein
MPVDRLKGWGTVLPEERIQIVPIPGDHMSLLEPPNIAALGEALSATLLHEPEPRLADVQANQENR